MIGAILLILALVARSAEARKHAMHAAVAIALLSLARHAAATRARRFAPGNCSGPPSSPRPHGAGAAGLRGAGREIVHRCPKGAEPAEGRASGRPCRARLPPEGASRGRMPAASYRQMAASPSFAVGLKNGVFTTVAAARWRTASTVTSISSRVPDRVVRRVDRRQRNQLLQHRRPGRRRRAADLAAVLVDRHGDA